MRADSKCSRCGSTRTRAIGQSSTPPGTLMQCQDCGVSTLAPLAAVAPSAPAGAADVDKRRIERLVNTVIAERQLSCETLAVDRASAGWHVVVRTRVGAFLKFDVTPDSMAGMRASIERALATAS
jgi:hypothetical protein